MSFISFLACSQAEFRKGFIITGKNDTIQGLIDYREGPQNFAYCSFKKSDDEPVVNYKPDELMGYRFDEGRCFISKSVSKNGEAPKLTFLQLLVKGKASLYRSETSYFVETDSAHFHELRNSMKWVVVSGQRHSVESKDYIRTLNLLFSDCAVLREKIQKTYLSKKSLTTLVEAYNQCVGSSNISFESNKRWSQVNWRLAMGVNFTSVDVNSNGASTASAFSSTPYKASVAPSLR